jgi:hypothetical protein
VPRAERAPLAQKLLCNYIPTPVASPVTFIRSVYAVRPLGTYFRGPTGGWGRYCTGALRVEELDLPHSGFMSGPGAPRVAGVIAAGLREIVAHASQAPETVRLREEHPCSA